MTTPRGVVTVEARATSTVEGKTGFGKAAHMAQTLWGARQDAKTSGEKALSTRTRSEMQERLERASMSQNKE